MMMTEYETTMVVRPDVSGDAIEATLDRVREAVKKSGGKLIAMNHWGKKKLNYPVKKHTRGIYVHAQYLGEKGLVAELERNLRISDTVLRWMTIQVAVGVKPEEREEKAYTRPQYESLAVSEDDLIVPRDERRDRGGWSKDRDSAEEGPLVVPEAAEVEE